MMKKLTTSLLLLTLCLGACSSTTSTPEIKPTASNNSNQVETSREAVLSEIENDVTVESVLANVGMVISVGQTVQTGENSRAKLNLNPEGTIVRIAPNSSFTLSQINEENGAPKTSLKLLFGKVFVLLKGGSLDVETPSGVASVRGSLLSVRYNPETNRVRASCLEGICSLQNEAGDEIEFTQNQSVFIDEDGNLSEIEEIDRDEIEEWLEFSELEDFLDELPDLEDYPDFDDDEWYEEESEEAIDDASSDE
jgi:hypothetical protein